MELNKFIKSWLKNWDFKICDKYDYYYKVAQLLRYHYIWTWGNHYFVSKKEQPRWNNKFWDGFSERYRTAVENKTKQTMKDNFFYTLTK